MFEKLFASFSSMWSAHLDDTVGSEVTKNMISGGSELLFGVLTTVATTYAAYKTQEVLMRSAEETEESK